MTGLVVTAFEGTAVTGAMPTVVRELGGDALYPWVFAAFLVASTVAVPLAGRLADRLGRRPVFTFGMALFLVASALCGGARSMAALVAFRALQGLGHGVINPIGTTISADLYTLEERAKIQGLFTGAWGLANAAGPVLGAWIVVHTSWRWVFLVNIPPGALAVALLLGAYIDPPRGPQRSLDLSGAALAAGAAASLLLAMDAHGGMPVSLRLAMVSATVVVGATLVFQQRTATDPLLSPVHLADPAVRVGAAGSLVAGALMYAPAAYVPLWISREGHGSALRSGAALIPMLLGWAVGSTLGVPVMVRRGMRTSAGGGLILAAVGITALAVTAARHGSFVWACASLTLLGLGLGPTANSFLLGAQARVDWHARGAVTALVHAARTLGGSMAIAALGALGPSATPRFVALAGLTWVGAVLCVIYAPAGAPALRRKINVV